MEFSVAKTIESLGGHVYTNSYPNYSSSPAFDFVNPGMNINLYTDIVPITNSSRELDYRIEQKVESSYKSKIEETGEERNEKEQSGAGMDPKVIQSFLHPRAIKTEMVELVKSKKMNKRKS